MPKRSTLRLITRDVTALPVTGKEAVYWGRDLAGFGVHVQANGRKVDVAQSRGPTGLRRVALGPCAGESIDKRRREATAIIDRIKRGENSTMPEPERNFAACCLRTYVNVHCKPKTAKLHRDGHRPESRSGARHHGGEGPCFKGCPCAPSAPGQHTPHSPPRRLDAGEDISIAGTSCPRGRNSLQGGTPLPQAVLRTPPMPERLLKLLLA